VASKTKYELVARDPRLVDNVPQRWTVRVPAGAGYPEDLVVETDWEQVTLMEATLASEAFEAEVRADRQKFFGPVA
jgi:hypothetical protein